MGLSEGANASEPEYDVCVQCHEEVVQAFSHSAMSKAASTRTFLNEWDDRGNDAMCLTCHAPSGGSGVQCRDCHGAVEHPVDKLEVPAVCARCHDAPGENTVRMHVASRSYRAGQNCLDCHAGNGTGNLHQFRGPSFEGFLNNVAHIRVAVLKDADQLDAEVRVSHRAGHGLPGGTTGRAVWLTAEGIDGEGAIHWRERVRFGWEHDKNGAWLDRSLKPDEIACVRFENLGRYGVTRVHVALIYQFSPGEFIDAPSADRRILDSIDIEIPATAKMKH